jgi:hypothetical protein
MVDLFVEFVRLLKIIVGIGRLRVFRYIGSRWREGGWCRLLNGAVGRFSART